MYSSIKIYTSVTNAQNVRNKISPMTHKKLKTPKRLKNNVNYTGAVTGQQTSENFHRPKLHHHKTTAS